MICAPGSGSGKTLITCALLRILKRRGFHPASFKCGPDYIDPMFHRTVLGIPSRNLDLFMAGKEGVVRALENGMKGSDIGVIEGVMGFFDGYSTGSCEGSSYDLSCVTKTPAILVVNARGMSFSVLPLVKGFCGFGDRKMIKGIILNNISSVVAKELSDRIYEETNVPVIGFLPVMKSADLKSRHLGLVLPGEVPGILEAIDRVSDELEANLDFDKLIEIAEEADSIDIDVQALTGRGSDSGNAFLDDGASCSSDRAKVKVGIARDEAFCFYYEDNLELLEEMGAEPVFFSPIHDRNLPDVSRLIIGGGYPELHAKELSENVSMLRGIKEAADSGMPILAECGGFMYLLESLEDPDGNEYKMTGVFPGRSHMTEKLSHFGYVKATKNTDNMYILEDEEILGHEFHYYKASDDGDVLMLAKPNGMRNWPGYMSRSKVFAGFAHLYYPSCPQFARRFLDA